jgi:predicted DNA-binding transcriptional regulator AlpA
MHQSIRQYPVPPSDPPFFTELPEMSTTLLDPESVAALLGVTTGALAKWRVEGPPKTPLFVKVGGRIRYPESAVESWLASRTRRSTSDGRGA